MRGSLFWWEDLCPGGGISVLAGGLCPGRGYLFRGGGFSVRERGYPSGVSVHARDISVCGKGNCSLGGGAVVEVLCSGEVISVFCILCQGVSL